MDLAVQESPSSRLWRLSAGEQDAIEQRGVVSRDVELLDYLQRVTQRLWKQVDSDLPVMTVCVLEDSGLNAYVFPNGISYLTSGMLSQTRNEDQLAMIVAHEMIHYVQQHAISAYNHLKTPFIDERNHSGGIGNPKRIKTSMKVLHDVAEIQADQEGLAIIKAAGYNPVEVLSLLDNMSAAITADQGSVGDDLFSRRKEIVQAWLDQHDLSTLHTTSTLEHEKDYLKSIAPGLLANARAAVRCGRWNVADNSVSTYLSVRADDPQAYFIKGQIQSQQCSEGKAMQAMAAYLKAIALDSAFAPAYRALGTIHLKSDQRTLAGEFFKTYLDLAPRAKDKEYILGYLRLCNE